MSRRRIVGRYEYGRELFNSPVGGAPGMGDVDTTYICTNTKYEVLSACSPCHHQPVAAKPSSNPPSKLHAQPSGRNLLPLETCLSRLGSHVAADPRMNPNKLPQ